MHARATVVVLVLALPVLAGCLGDASTGPTGLADGRLPTGQPSRAELDARGLDAAPQFFVGQWWQYRFDHERTGIARQVTLVVAGAEGDDLLVGMPVDAFDDAVLVTHMPPVGTIERASWGYDVGGEAFVPLDFPLVEGKTWTTQWGDAPDRLVAVVSSVDGQSAIIDLVGATQHIQLTYDARMGAIREFEMPGHGTYHVLDYGYGFEGEIAVPSMATPVFHETRVQALLDGDSNPAAPVATIPVEGPFDHISVLMMAGPQLDRLPGAYRLEAIAPDGTAFVMTSAPPESAALRWRIFHHDQVVGPWDVSWLVVGHGFGVLEGTAYDARHFRLGDVGGPSAVPLTRGA